MLRLVLVVSIALVASANGKAQPPSGGSSHPVASPGGHQIAIVSGRDGTSDLYVIDADGPAVARLTNTAETEGIAGWSADGARVVYSVFRNDTSFIYSVARDGSSRKELGRVQGRAVKVAADASLAITGAGPWETMQLFASALDGSGRRRVTDGTSAFWCHALSDDGKRIATARADSGDIRVWVLNVDGSAARQVTHFPRSEGGAQCPSWSPDGRRLALQSAARYPADSTKQVGHVWVVDVTSGAAKRVGVHTEPFLDETPTWFPDGKRLAFQSNRTGRWEIWIINVDGTGVRQLTR